MTTTLTHESPFAARLLAYSNERFPYWQIVGQLPMFVTAYTFGRVLGGHAPAFTLNLVLGFIAFVAYTLMVRCIDDHKDAQHDNAMYPDRVLQRGLITFTHLKIIAVICVLILVGVSLWADQGIGLVTLWLVMIFVSNNLVQWIQIRWSHIGRWLEERRVLLALTVVPFWGFGAMWAAQMGAGDTFVSAEVWWLAASWCVASFLLEIARKSRDPEDERPGVVDYTKDSGSWTRSLGLNGTVLTLMITAVAVVLLQAATLASVHATSWWTYVALAATLIIPLGATVRFVMLRNRYRVKEVAESAAGVWLFGQIISAIALFVLL